MKIRRVECLERTNGQVPGYNYKKLHLYITYLMKLFNTNIMCDFYFGMFDTIIWYILYCRHFGHLALVRN